MSFQLTPETLIKVKTTIIRGAPKDIYIAGSLELIKRLFKNAYIIPNVKWGQFPAIFNEFTGRSTEEFSGLRFWELRKHRNTLKKEIEELNESFHTAYTVIPFTPKKDLGVGITDWKLDENNILNNNRSLFNNYYSYNSEPRKFMRLLLENANAMSILLRGVLYETPCEFCALLFNRISGECEIFNTDKYQRQTCQPRITFGAHMFSENDVDLEEKIDYSKALVQDVWQSTIDEKMEV